MRHATLVRKNNFSTAVIFERLMNCTYIATDGSPRRDHSHPLCPSLHDVPKVRSQLKKPGRAPSNNWTELDNFFDR